MSIDDLQELPFLMLLAAVWLAINAAWVAAVARRVLIQRRAERMYRLRLAHWRAMSGLA